MRTIIGVAALHLTLTVFVVWGVFGPSDYSRWPKNVRPYPHNI